MVPPKIARPRGSLAAPKDPRVEKPRTTKSWRRPEPRSGPRSQKKFERMVPSFTPDTTCTPPRGFASTALTPRNGPTECFPDQAPKTSRRRPSTEKRVTRSRPLSLDCLPSKAPNRSSSPTRASPPTSSRGIRSTTPNPEPPKPGSSKPFDWSRTTSRSVPPGARDRAPATTIRSADPIASLCTDTGPPSSSTARPPIPNVRSGAPFGAKRRTVSWWSSLIATTTRPDESTAIRTDRISQSASRSKPARYEVSGAPSGPYLEMRRGVHVG